jgi:hypothetical protein
LPIPRITGPCLVADGVLLTNSLDVVAPALLDALSPMPPSRAVAGYIGFQESGRSVAAHLDATGVTPEFARTELELTLDLVQAAHSGLSERTRRRLDWPLAAEKLTADRWLVAYAKDRSRWLLDMAGGLTPATLLRCCLLARPRSTVELWLDAEVYEPGRVLSVEPSPAPMRAEAARAILLRGQGEPVERAAGSPDCG